MNRRDFIKKTAVLTVAAGTADITRAAGFIQPSSEPLPEGSSATVPEGSPVTVPEGSPVTVPEGSPEGPSSPASASSSLLASPPMLQNYAETSIGIAFAVNDMANGFVIIGRQPDLSDGRKVLCGGYRTTEISDRVCQVRITGLEPATTYYYRIGADRIEYKGGYKMKNLGTQEDSTVYHFTTAGAAARAHFCVINDTHASWRPFGLAIEKIAQLAPSCVLWNGDASNSEETIEAQMRIFLTPDIERRDYATQIPYLFCPGNHDFRGMANRHLERVWLYRQPEERDVRDWDLGRNFAVRMGDIAMIGLDTGEDKLDTNPIFAGIFNMKAYREAQTRWLRDALQQPEIASAPFLVAFCHIPLFDSNPKHNPGDVAPDDKDPQYNTDFAMWQRTCAELWCPLLEKAKCQLVITAHQHHYQYFEPTENRSWAEIVGGGPEMGQEGGKKYDHLFPTVIEGEVKDRQLHITVHNLLSGNIQQSFDFAPRKVRKAKGKRK